MLWLIAEVGDFRDAGLHAEGHFVVVDAVLNLGIGSPGKLVLVQFFEAIQHQPAAVGAHACGVAEVEHGVLRCAEENALMLGGQEAAAPEVGTERLAAFAFGDEDGERRQIRVICSESIAEPRAETWPARDLRSCLEERHAGAVIDRLREHGARHADVVGDAGGMRQQFAEPSASLAVLGELEGCR